MTSPSTTSTPANPTRRLRVHIMSPRAGSHTGQDLTVRIRVTGTASGRVHAFRYLLDGVLTRHGDGRLTFHGLAPGRQHLVVSVTGQPTVHAAAVFVVRAPPPPPAPPPMSNPAPPMSAPAPAMSNPSPPMSTSTSTTPMSTVSP
jgi:hypothetical protein